MNVPDNAKLWETYTTKLFLKRSDIAETFGCSESTAARMIREAKKAQEGLSQFGPHTVRTREAFEFWGIDVNELKRRIKETKK